MSKNFKPDIQLSPKALRELKEALYLEIGERASEYSASELQRLGNHILRSTAIYYRMKIREIKKNQLQN